MPLVRAYFLIRLHGIQLRMKASSPRCHLCCLLHPCTRYDNTFSIRHLSQGKGLLAFNSESTVRGQTCGSHWRLACVSCGGRGKLTQGLPLPVMESYVMPVVPHCYWDIFRSQCFFSSLITYSSPTGSLETYLCHAFDFLDHLYLENDASFITKATQ